MNPFEAYLTYAVIDLEAIAYNTRALKAHIGPDVEMFAVVKANAYGHGLIPVSRTVLENGATRLAVGRVDQGIQIRQAGITAPIVMLDYTMPAEAETVAANDMVATVNTIEGARALSARSVALGKTSLVHVKVDTGMGRYGLLPEEVLPFMEQISTLPGLDIEGLYTHFATADQQDKTYVYQQYDTYAAVLQAVEAAGYHIRVRHVANTAAVLDMPEMHLNAVRPGIALYGMYPSGEVSTTVRLRPALSLKSHVGRVRTLPTGSSISYGRTYVTSHPTPVALVPVGYGDGYHRLLSNRACVLIKGRRAPIAGRVCMDKFVVDISGIEGVKQDDEVVLIGSQGEETIRAEELAALADTINYEITTSISSRVPRIYVREGRVVETVLLIPDGYRRVETVSLKTG